MPKITTFLTYKDRAEEAAAFYVSLFPNSRIVRTTHFGEVGPAPPGTVMTVVFELDGREYVALNGGPHFVFTEAFSLAVECETQEEIDRYWTALTADGGVEGPCGWLTDRFGVSWQVNPAGLADMLEDPNAERAARVFTAIMGMKKLVVDDLRRAYDGR